MINYEQITELFKTEAFQSEAANCKTMEDFHALFVRSGVEITEEETIELISLIAEQKKKMDEGEISEEDLDNVAGGLVFVLTGGVAVAACVGIGVACVGAFALSAYVGYQALNWQYKKKKK